MAEQSISQHLDLLLDGPQVKFQIEIDKIESKQIPLGNSPLFQFLKADVKEALQSLDDMGAIVRTIQTFYSWDVCRISNLDIFAELFQKNYSILRTYVISKLMVTESKQDNMESCVMELFSGFHAISSLVLDLTFLRFRQYFHIPEYLFTMLRFMPATGIKRASGRRILPRVVQLKEQIDIVHKFMILSRYNYILTGIYLPIFLDISIPKHASSVLILPKADSHIFYTVFIDSSSAPQSDDIKFVIQQSFDRFKASISSQNILQSQQPAIVFLYCLQNIQKFSGTCADWSTLLAYLFLANADQDTIDSVDSHNSSLSFCKEISERLKDQNIFALFMTYFIDLRKSCNSYILELFLKNSSNFQQFYNAITQGSIHSTLPLNKEIFSRALGLFQHVFPHRFTKQDEGNTRRRKSIFDTSAYVDDETITKLTAEEIMMNDLLQSVGK